MNSDAMNDDARHKADFAEEAYAYASARDYTYTAKSAASAAGMSQGTFVRYARKCGVYHHGGGYRIDDILAVTRARDSKRKGGKA